MSGNLRCRFLFPSVMPLLVALTDVGFEPGARGTVSTCRASWIGDGRGHFSAFTIGQHVLRHTDGVRVGCMAFPQMAGDDLRVWRSGLERSMKNPFMSMWLSQANAWAGVMRGFWTAEMQRQQTQMMQEMTKQMLQFWGGAWKIPTAPEPVARRSSTHRR